MGVNVPNESFDFFRLRQTSSGSDFPCLNFLTADRVLKIILCVSETRRSETSCSIVKSPLARPDFLPGSICSA